MSVKSVCAKVLVCESESLAFSGVDSGCYGCFAGAGDRRSSGSPLAGTGYSAVLFCHNAR